MFKAISVICVLILFYDITYGYVNVSVEIDSDLDLTQSNSMLKQIGQTSCQLDHKTSTPKEESAHDILARLDKKLGWNLNENDHYDGYWEDYYDNALAWGY